MEENKKVKKPLAENDIRRQLDSFVPEVIIGLVGIAALFLMVWHFGYARVFITQEKLFGFYGMLFDLIMFDVSFSLCLFGGFSNIVIYLYFHKKDKNQIPHQISLALSVILITFSITLSLFVFAF